MNKFYKLVARFSQDAVLMMLQYVQRTKTAINCRIKLMCFSINLRNDTSPLAYCN